MSEELKAALARIACLEGEIAKRDETIARLEPQLMRSTRPNDKDRMDFICANPRWLICDRKGRWQCVNPFTQYAYPIFDCAREAVDWALGYRGGKE